MATETNLTQVRRLRTGLGSDDCYDYTFLFLMLLHLPLIISLNFDCAYKEQRHSMHQSAFLFLTQSAL